MNQITFFVFLKEFCFHNSIHHQLNRFLYPYLFLMAQTGVFINLVLMVFNLLPIPPLDGGRVLRSVVNEKIGRTIDLIEPYGFFIVVGLLFLGALQPIFKIVQSIATIFI